MPRLRVQCALNRNDLHIREGRHRAAVAGAERIQMMRRDTKSQLIVALVEVHIAETGAKSLARIDRFKPVGYIVVIGH